jgi:hypothetical protein
MAVMVTDARRVLPDQQRHQVVPQVGRHGQLPAVQRGVPEAGDPVGRGDPQRDEVPARTRDKHLGALDRVQHLPPSLV